MFKNQVKTALLLGTLAGLLAFLGKAIGGYEGIYSGLIMAGCLSLFSYYFSSSLVLSIHRARPFSQNDHPSLYSTIDELTKEMNLPMPKLYYIPSRVANAFATGRNPQNAVIGITDGILNLLDPHELRGVLAHELAHIQNRDTLLMAVASTMAIAIGYIANLVRHMFLFSPKREEQGDHRKRLTPFTTFIVVTLMPFAATLLRLAISRNREFVADEIGALASRDPLALASALEKMHHHKRFAHFPIYDTARVSTAPLFIINPLWGKGMLISLFSTHPPVEERISRLKKLYERMFNH